MRPSFCSFLFICMVFSLLSTGSAVVAQVEHGIKEYTATRVVGTPPTMDGDYTDEEWQNAEWATGLFGLNNQGSNGANQGMPVDLNYRWRAIWDDEYLYILIEAEMYDLPINGVIGGEITDNIVEGDDEVFSFALGLGTDIEIFLEPNWREGDGFNSNPPSFTEPGGDGITDGYQFVWFPLENDEHWTPLNSGIRNADAPDGPPWFYTESAYNSAFVGGPWDPTFNPSEAAAFDAMPMIAGTDFHYTGAARYSGEVYARPVLEVAIPFSQMNPNFGVPEEGEPGETNLTLERDDNGTFVNPGDEWLINIAGYTDPYTASRGLTLISWNNVIGPQFASYPRGILHFAADPTPVSDWMIIH